MQEIKLDLTARGIAPRLLAKQGDVGRKFRAVITDNGEAYDIPVDALLSVWYSGTSGEGNYSMIGENSAFSIVGNTVTVELITQMLTNPGGGNVCLVMNRQDGTQIGTWNLPYIVEQLPGMGSPAAEQYFTALTEAAAKAAQSAAQAAEAAATFETDTSLSVAGKAADAAATGAAIKKARPVNLLDNSDFRNPVNQRGAQYYEGETYCIDRWKLENANSAIGIVDGGIHLKCISGYAGLIQNLERGDKLYGKTLTFAIEADANVYTTMFKFRQAAGGLPLGDSGLTLYSADGDDILLRSYGDNEVIGIRWAALYEGEYTIDTLPEYQPKGYGAELLECQRYYVAYDFYESFSLGKTYSSDGTKADIQFSTSSNLRLENPTIVNELSLCMAAIDGINYPGTLLSATASGNTVSMIFQSSESMPLNTMCILRMIGKFVLSADL